MSKAHYKQSTINSLSESFGFNLEIVSSKAFKAHDEIRTRYTVKRPNGKKFYHAIMLSNGEILI